MAAVAAAPLFTAFGTTATVGTALTAASTAFTLFSGIQSYSQAKSAASAERTASQSRASELQLQMQQERTQEAIESAERARQLRRQLASQRAAGAGRVDESGNILNIQEQTQDEFERTNELSQFKSDMTVTNLNRQAMSTLRAGENAYAAGMSGARTSLINTISTVGGQVSDISSTMKTKPSTFTSPRTGEVVTWRN